jgi:protein Mpv17
MFNRIFGKHLLLTNTISSGVLMAGGDLIQQEIERYRTVKGKPFDWKRAGLCCMHWGKSENYKLLTQRYLRWKLGYF